MSEHYTTIFKSFNTDRDPEDICHCQPRTRDYDDYYDYYDYWTDESNKEYCDCGNKNSDPDVTATKVVVRVLGNPIRFKPEDCTYNVLVWTTRVKESTSEYIFDEYREPEAKFEEFEFTIASTVDPVDLETMYGGMAQRYLTGLDPDFQPYEKGFRAPVKVTKYIGRFQKIIGSIIRPPKQREASECAHVEARSSGQSHFIPKDFQDKKSKKANRKTKIEARRAKRK